MLTKPNPWGGEGWGLIYKNNFCWELKERSRSVNKTPVHLSPPPMGVGVSVNLLKIFCARKYIKCPKLYRKVTFANPLTYKVGLISNKIIVRIE